MNSPLLGTESAMVAIGTTFVDGPRKSRIETDPGVVGFQVIWKGAPTGTCWLSPGAEMGLPSGAFEVSAGVSADAADTRAAIRETDANFILAISGRNCFGVYYLEALKYSAAVQWPNGEIEERRFWFFKRNDYDNGIEFSDAIDE